MSLLRLDGNGFPPGTPRHGSSKPPCGLSTRTVCPHGACPICVPLRNCVGYSTYVSAYDARTDVRPLPSTSHANPRRGEKSVQYELKTSAFGFAALAPLLCCWKPGSPGYRKLGGAFTNTLLRIPC